MQRTEAKPAREPDPAGPPPGDRPATPRELGPDEGAAAVIRRHQAGVWRYLRFLGADPSLAEDLTQETFLAYLRSPPASRDPRATAAWLRRTAQRRLSNSRRRPRLPTLGLEAAEDAWGRYAADDSGDDALVALQHCLHGLTARMRTAVRVRYGPGGSRQAVATELHLTLDGAKTLLRRARRRLQLCIQRGLAR